MCELHHPVRAGHEGVVYVLLHYDRGGRHGAVGEALGERHHVRRDAEALRGEGRAQASEAEAVGYVTIGDDRYGFTVRDASAVEGGDLTFTIEYVALNRGRAYFARSVQWTTGDDATAGASQATAGTDYTEVREPIERNADPDR